MRLIAIILGIGCLGVVGAFAWQGVRDAAPDKGASAVSPAQEFAAQSPGVGSSLRDIEASLPDASYRILTNDPGLLARGEVVYRSACAVCHGINLEGQANWQMRDADGNLPAPPHDKTGHTWHHSDDVLFNLVKFGPGYYVPGYSGKMPAYGELLEDRDIKAVNSWIASTWPTEILLAQRERTLASEQQH